MSQYRPFLSGLLACALVSGCMVVPRTTVTYDADCRQVRKQITLESQQVGAIAICRNNAECAGLLALYGFAAAASVVVSGSIALVGNVAYWLEEQGQCVRERGGPPPSTPLPSAAVRPLDR